MQNRIYLRAFEPDDYKTTIEWRNNPLITNKLGGVFYMFRKHAKRNGLKTLSSTRLT